MNKNLRRIPDPSSNTKKRINQIESNAWTVPMMRSGIQILSRSTRRRRVAVRRRLPNATSQVRVFNTPLVATESFVFQSNEIDATISNESTLRCFASLQPGDTTTFDEERETVDTSKVDDFGAPIFDDEMEDGDPPDGRRIWMDPETPLEQRVNRFINQPLGSIHHLDIKLTSLDLIRACGKRKSFEGMKNAQDILDRLIEEKKYVNNSQDPAALVIIPDRPFKMVMYGWANMCRKVAFAPQRMREVLDLMMQEAEYDKKLLESYEWSRIEEEHSGEDGNSNDNDSDSIDDTKQDLFLGLSCEPTVDIYNTLLQGLSEAATRSIQAAIEAEQALSKMDKMNRTRGWHTKPNTRSYSLALNAYAKSRHATAGDRAESVLRDMMERHEHEKLEYLEENGIDYNTVDPDVNNRNIVTPDTIAYTTVIQAHGNSDLPASADKALMLLNELIHSDHPALEPDSFAFANTINAFSKMAAGKKSPNHRVEAAERAEEILWMMVDEMQNNPHSDKLSGSIVPFNACLNVWAQSFTPESPHRAEDLLHRMLDPELQSITQVQPNTVSFNTCMQAWSKACKFEDSASPEKAEELLNLLVKLADETTDGKNWELRPDARSYVTVMNAYASSKRADSVGQTRRLLMDLIQEGRGKYFDSGGKDRINAHPFTIVLKAAANAKTSDRSSDEGDDYAFGSLDEGLLAEDPYEVASKTYSELLNDTFDLGVSADHFAFSEMLSVVAKYTAVESIERRQRVEEVFQDACSAGQLSSLVIRAMEKACPNNILLAELLRLRGNTTVGSIETINMFPKQWTSNVPREFRRVSSRNDHFKKQSKFFRSKKKSKRDDRHGKKPPRRNHNN